MPSLKYNPKTLKYYGESSYDTPAGLQVGDKAYFFNTEKNVVWDGDSWVDDKVNTDTTLETGDLEIGAVEIKNSTDDTRATVGANGLHVDGVSRTTTATFHTTATVAANGTPFTVGAYKTLTVEIYGTSTSRTVTFYGKSKSGTFRAIQGVRLSDFTLATSTTGTGEIWQFDTTGLDTITMDLTAVAGGNVTVAGNAIA